MPVLNDFHAHIISVKPGHKIPFKTQIIPESGSVSDGNSKTVTCYIPANSGEFFAAWWWPTGEHKKTMYSAEFIRDGESVVLLLFDEKAIVKCSGGLAADWEDDDGEIWKFQFRSFECTGKSGPSLA